MSITSTTSNLSHAAELSNLERLRTIEKRFNEKLIGQQQAIATITEQMQMYVNGLFDEAKPLGVWLFAGPTGVGKTELAKLVAEELSWPLHRFDMSEFHDRYNVSRLIGAPPGYKGHGNGGELVKKLKKTPCCVLLFDEIEKAHSGVANIFLQLFDEGRLTDMEGETVTTTKIIVIMTTNLGSHDVFEKKSEVDVNEKVTSLFVQKFSPELLGRVHRIVLFNSLQKEQIVKIAENYFSNCLLNVAKQRNLTITWERNIVATVLEGSVDVRFGARSIHQLMKEYAYRVINQFYMSDAPTADPLTEIASLHLSLDNKKTVILTPSAKQKRRENSDPSLKIPQTQKSIKRINAVTQQMHLQNRYQLYLNSKEKKYSGNSLLNVYGVLENYIDPPAPDNVCYIDRRGLPASQLVGKYVVRTELVKSVAIDDIFGIHEFESPRKRSKEYLLEAIDSRGQMKINTTPYSTKGEEESCFFVGPTWNDDKWSLPTPNENPKGFFNNLCLNLRDKKKRNTCLELVNEIFLPESLNKYQFYSDDPFGIYGPSINYLEAIFPKLRP